MTPEKALKLLRNGGNIKLTKQCLDGLGEQYKFIVEREQYGEKYVDGAPQWLTWYGLAASGTLTSKWNRLSQDGSSMPLDAAAIAPTNVTHSRISFLASNPNTEGGIFRFVSSILMNVHDVRTAKAVQLATIAASPAPISDEKTYERLWRRYDPESEDDRMDVQVLVTRDGKKETLVVR